MSILNNALLLKKAAASGGGDGVTKSLRFNDGDTPSLSRTYTSSATWTFSVWVKRGELGATNNLLGTVVQFNSSDQLVTPGLTTTAVYRDVGAWYHICVSNSGLYVNGEQVTGTVSTAALSSAEVGDTFDGFLADAHLIDGTSLDATSFAEEDATTGQWVPKAYSGSYGTAGFRLDFADSSDIGNDVSGNGNDFTATNLVASDVMLDNPSAGSNFCLLNPLDVSQGTLSEGSTKYTATSSEWGQARSTFAASTGKWYWEVTATTVSESQAWIAGILEINKENIDTYWYDGSWSNATNGNCYGVQDGNYKITGSSQSSFTSGITSGSVVGFHLDLDSATTTLAVSVDGVDKGTMFSSLTAAEYSPALNLYGDAGAVSVADVNFGQGDPNGNNNYQDGNGKGNFKYEPDSGFLAWCTNTQTATIAKPSEYFDINLWSGDSTSTRNISTPFDPFFVWIKSRGNSGNGSDHTLWDNVRGVSSSINTSLSSSEDEPEGFYNDITTTANFGGVSAFGTQLYTLKEGVSNARYVNETGRTYVGWSWKGGSTDSFTGGAEEYNATSGISIIKWTGDSSGPSSDQDVEHNLGAAPEFILAKNRTNDNGMTSHENRSWICWHKDLSADNYIRLDTNDAEASYGSGFGGGTQNAISGVTSSQVTFDNDTGTAGALNQGAMMGDAETYFAILLTSVDGFSKFGKFTGTEDTSGIFVYCGFRPAMILTKKASGAGAWTIWDDARATYNPANKPLYPNTSGAEPAGNYPVDFCSNGFVIRTDNDDINGSSETHIFGAWAAAPFKFASAR